MQKYAEAESRANLFAHRHCPQTSGGPGLTDGSVAVPVASRKACSAEAPPYFCRRQKSQKPRGLPQAKIAEAGRFAAGKSRRSREVCRRQKSQKPGGLPQAKIADIGSPRPHRNVRVGTDAHIKPLQKALQGLSACASVPTRTVTVALGTRYSIVRRNRSAMGSAMLGAYCREIFGARRVILRIIIYFSPLCNNYVIKNCLICRI